MQQSSPELTRGPRSGGAGVVVLVLAVILVLAGLVTWLVFKPEPRGEDQDPSTFLPADASMVAVLHLDRLFKKSDLAGIIKGNPQLMAMLQAMGGVNLDEDSDLTRAGLRSDVPIHVFNTSTGKGGQIVGVVTPLSDRDLFEQSLESVKDRVAQFLPDSTELEISEVNGVRGIFRTDMVFAYTHQAMLVLIQPEPGEDLQAKAIRLLKEGGKLTEQSESFRDFQSADYDLGVWYHGQVASKGILDQLRVENLSPEWRMVMQALGGGAPVDEEAEQQMLEGQLEAIRAPLAGMLATDASLGVRFEEGRAVTEITAWHNGKADLPTRTVDNALVEALPGDAVFAGAAAVEVDTVLESVRAVLPENWQEELKWPLMVTENLSGMKLDELTELPGKLGGDVVVAASTLTADAEAPKEPGPLVPPYVRSLLELAGLDLSFLDNLQGMLQGVQLPEMDIVLGLSTREAGAMEEPLKKMEKFTKLVGMESAVRGTSVFLTSETEAASLRDTGRSTRPLPDDQRALLANQHVAGFIHLGRLAEMLGQLPEPVRLQVAGGMLANVDHFKDFEWLAFAARSDAKAHRISISLHFKNREDNSLRSLIQMGIDSVNAPGMPGAGQIFPRDDDGPGFPDGKGLLPPPSKGDR